MLVLVGNSPSSGSSLLADILDSTDFTACGSELNFWSNRFLYDFQKFKANPSRFSNTFQITATGLFPHYDVLNQYGIEKRLWHKWIDQSESVQEFSESFAKHFLSFRQKDKAGIVFEKSPENINCVAEFLEAFPESYFINIIRDPLYVYASCLKRKFGHFVSAMNWMVDATVIKAFSSHPRFISIKYEELVQNPFEIVAKIIAQISSRKVESSVLKDAYQSNLYKKKNSDKIGSWEFSEYGEVRNANLKVLPEKLLKDFSAVSHYQISEAYAELFNIEVASYTDLVDHFGYSLPEDTDAQEVRKNFKDYRKLIAKVLRLRGRKLSDFNTVLNPAILKD